MAGEDFVHVKLSKRGEELAKDAPITVVHGNSQFTFNLGEKPQRVTRAIEWTEILDRIHDSNGDPLFEIDTTKQSAVSTRQSAKEMIIDVPALECEACGARATTDNLVDTIVHNKGCPNFGTARLNVPGQESKD